MFIETMTCVFLLCFKFVASVSARILFEVNVLESDSCLVPCLNIFCDFDRIVSIAFFSS